jgi:hypothetical protein
MHKKQIAIVEIRPFGSTKMYTLTEAQYRLESEPILRKIFINDDPSDSPFMSEVKSRRIIFDYHYLLEPPLTDAITSAGLKSGDAGCYISSLWRPGPEYRESKEPYHWYLPWSEFELYYEGYLGSIYGEHVLYSPEGKWGVMISDTHYGLLGGTIDFVEEVNRNFPELDQQVYQLLEYFRDFKANYEQATLGWLPGVLSNVYGDEKTSSMLQDFNLP